MPMTYSSLLIQLDQMVDRDPDTDDRWAAGRVNCIEMAERRISRELNLSCFHKADTGTMTIGSDTVPRPENVISGTNFEITLPSNEVVALRFVSLSWLREWWPYPTSTAQPRYVAVRGDNQFAIGPPADFAYPWRYSYRKHGEFLSDSNARNNLTDNYPDLLLSAASCEAAIYMQEDRRDALAASYEQRYARLRTAIGAAEGFLGLPQFEIGDHVAQEPPLP